MLDRANLLALMKTAATAKPSMSTYSYGNETFSYDALNETLRKELNDLIGNEELFEQNKRKAFSLVEETLDEVVPTKLENVYGSFAEIKTYPQSTRPVFKRRMGLQRAKQFVTRVGLAGRYETFKLGEEALELKTSAMGGAYRVSYEEILDGRVNLAELGNIITDGMNQLIYQEVEAALIAGINQLPAANKVEGAGFFEAAMDQLVSTASAYGSPAIYCTREFAHAMLPSDSPAWFSDRMKEEAWAKGYLASYKGCPVIILPQSVTDETNSKKILDPGYAWILPSGDNKPVKIGFEGTTHMRDVEDNDDWSHDFQVYRKVGVAVMMTPNIFVYHNSKLSRTIPAAQDFVS